MTETPAFLIPGELLPSTPFNRMHFWQWAQSQPRDAVTVLHYLQSLGFVLGRDRLNESQLDSLDAACDTYHRIAPHMSGVRRFADLFTPAASGGFYVAGKPMADRPGRYTPSPELISALVGSGWIYDVTPDSTYFEIVNGVLLAKYQQIIGSRALAQLLEE